VDILDKISAANIWG